MILSRLCLTEEKVKHMFYYMTEVVLNQEYAQLCLTEEKVKHMFYYMTEVVLNQEYAQSFTRTH